MIVINGKKYNPNTSEILVKRGFEMAISSRDGQLVIYRTQKGNLWGTFKYWPNAYGAQNITTFEGEEAVRTYLHQYASAQAIEKVFGELEEA